MADQAQKEVANRLKAAADNLNAILYECAQHNLLTSVQPYVRDFESAPGQTLKTTQVAAGAVEAVMQMDVVAPVQNPIK